MNQEVQNPSTQTVPSSLSAVREIFHDSAFFRVSFESDFGNRGARDLDVLGLTCARDSVSPRRGAGQFAHTPWNTRLWCGEMRPPPLCAERATPATGRPGAEKAGRRAGPEGAQIFTRTPTTTELRTRTACLSALPPPPQRLTLHRHNTPRAALGLST